MDLPTRSNAAGAPNDAARATTHYWPEIDGLRAIAILLVIAFHAGVPQFAGGFIGVDVFFVLSGFLITGLLAREIEKTGGIDLVDFYARRARRLMPALTVVLLATLAAGLVLLVPVGEQQNLGKSAIAASGFLANIFFWRTQSSYFAGPSEEIPLLHLWTLSVEEQFYIVWPLVMIAIAVLTRKRPGITLRVIVAALVLASLVSFAACWMLTLSRGTLTFYTVPFRAWEFGIGALLALLPFAIAVTASMRIAGVALLVSGLAAVVGAGLAFSSGTVFPGIAATLPVLGTAAAIAGVRLAPGSLPARALAAGPMVTIGKLSYSWYLWHWPLLALGRAHAMGEHSALRDGLLVLLALALSAATYRWIEEPVRRHKPGPFSGSWSSVLAGLGLMAATAALAGGLWWQAEKQVARSPMLAAAKLALSQQADVPVECTNFRFQFSGLAPLSKCGLGGGENDPLVLLWGDSHAFHYLPGLVEWGREHRTRVVPRAAGACKPHYTKRSAFLPAHEWLGADNCIKFNEAVTASLQSFKAMGGVAVVLAGRWSVPSRFQSSLGDWERELQELVGAVRKAGLKVVLLAETPGWHSVVPVCAARFGADACSREREEVNRERAGALVILRKLTSGTDDVTLIDPIDVLCTRARCDVVRDTTVLYSDKSHLSVAGSRMLAPLFGAAMAPLIAIHR